MWTRNATIRNSTSIARIANPPVFQERERAHSAALKQIKDFVQLIEQINDRD
jgi:hypothetical protein